MGLSDGSIRLYPNRSFLSPSDNRQLYRVSIGCSVHAAAAASVHHTYVGEDRRILASPCTGLSTDAPSFSFALCRHPFCLSRCEIDAVSRVTLSAWPGQGYGRHWLFFRALSPICILSVAGRSIVLKVIWIFVLYICILDSWSRCYIYICSVGPIEDCCVMLLLRFPPARKCLVGTFESFLCGFGEFCSTLHRPDSEGVTGMHQYQYKLALCRAVVLLGFFFVVSSFLLVSLVGTS